MEVTASKEMKKYFDEIDEKVKLAYATAKKARSKGYEPGEDTLIPLAKNMAERVEGLISTISPQIANSGLSRRIKELEKISGELGWKVALTIALEVAQEKICKFESQLKAMETGIRIGLAYLTLGIVASPIEGFVELKIKKRQDHKDYFCLMYSGPIRSAGGTAAAVSVIVADYIRKNMGYLPYDPTYEEIQRTITELYDYHERIANLQYLPSPGEIDFLIKHLPVQIDGDPSEEEEVSQYKDLKRIETNRIRSGVCLVIGEGIAQKAPKILKQLDKWGKEFGLEEWFFIKDFVELQKKIKAKTTEKTDKIMPIYTYIEDIVAGRPVLTHPLRAGGFRLRYGRSRASGYSSAAIHPALTYALKGYIAIGTQLKVERPGKAAAISCSDSIEGPIVKLINGDVIRLGTIAQAKKVMNDIEEILFLGDILFSYGDFFNRAHILLPPGYCEEWWIQELEKAIVNTFGALDLDKLSNLTNIPIGILDFLLKEPLKQKPTSTISIQLSKQLNIPMHPYYTYHWNLISPQELLNLMNWFDKNKIITENEKIQKIILPLEKDKKRILELIGLPHKSVNNEYVAIERDDASATIEIFALENKDTEKLKEIIKQNKEKSTLEIINLFSPVKLRDKSGYFIGARMGRPEKAKVRKLDGRPHVLFPVGEEGGKLRCFQSAMEIGEVNAEFSIYKCTYCNKETIFGVCLDCDKKTKKAYFCKTCGVIENEECKHGKASPYKKTSLDIKSIIKKLQEKLKETALPDLIKGVRGTSNKEHVSEYLMKGILRAKYDVYVNKDGTTRYDMTQLAITHFKPKEIQTSIEKLKELGYEKDIYGRELINDNQILELKPQDVILPSCEESPEEGADKILFRLANFIDELLVKLYELNPFYGLQSEKDLVGSLVIALAPHTSAAIIGRVIGFSKTQGFFAHPMLHAATRRDCLGFDNYVTVKENGTWKIEKIGTFIENFNPNQKADNFGTLRRDISNISTLSNPGEGKIVEITKHRPSKMLRLFLEDGRKIELTENHKVYVKGKKEKIAYELREGDKLIVSYKKDIEERDQKEIFLPEIFSDRDDIMIRNVLAYFKRFESLSKHENFCNRDSFPIKFVKDFLNKYNKSFKDLPPTVKIAIKRDNISLPIRILLDEELLEVIGLYIAEGYLRKNTSKKGFYQISIAGNDKIKNLVKKVFYSHFDLKPSYENSDQVVFSSRVVFELFRDYLGTGENAKNKRIPSLFLNLKKEKLAALLRGYFEGDGSVSSKDIRVTCDTVSEGLKHDLSFVLSRFDIFTKFYEYEKEPGPKVKEFYLKKQKKVPSFKINKIIILSNFVKRFKQIGFISERKNKILDELCQKDPYGTRIDFDEEYAYPKITRIEKNGEKTSYCFNVPFEHNFFANDILVHNCDGDEASITLLMDVLLNFSRQFLPNNRGATQDAPLVLTSHLIPSEIDDMVFDMDVCKRYPLEFYEACLNYKQPWDVEIEQLGKRLNKEEQYEKFRFTHDVEDINAGVRCSAYKTLPSMEDKLKGQMELAEKIRAVDTTDVARLVIEKHFLRDIKGNLRKFSQQIFRCVNCNEKYRRPPLIGKCTKCNGRIIFTVSEGTITKYLEPAISLAAKYDLPPYVKQSLELTKRRVEGVFGKETEKQVALGQWFR